MHVEDDGLLESGDVLVSLRLSLPLGEGDSVLVRAPTGTHWDALGRTVVPVSSLPTREARGPARTHEIWLE